jgi:hypothetical protein
VHHLTHDHYVSLSSLVTFRSSTACSLLPHSRFHSSHSSAHVVSLTQSVLAITPLINNSATHKLQWSLLLTDAALLQQLRNLVLHPPVDVRLVNWNRPEESFSVRVGSVSDLRHRAASLSGLGSAVAGAGLEWPKLYVFVSTPTAPRGATARIKLTNDDTLDYLADATPRNTVYFFNELDEGPDTPPKDARPRDVVGVTDGVDSAATRSESGASRASSTIRKEFQALVQKRYIQDALIPPKCFCCGTSQGMTTFDAAHIVPYFLDLDEYLQVKLGSKSDPRNGVLMCRECHKMHDKGAWNFDKVERVEKRNQPSQLKLRVWVSEGLQEQQTEWKDRHGTHIFCPDDYRWPYLGVWEAGWKHNAERMRGARTAKRARKGLQCGVCFKHFKENSSFNSHECKPNPVSSDFLISPQKTWQRRQNHAPLDTPKSSAIPSPQGAARGSDSINCRHFNSAAGCRKKKCRFAHKCNRCGSPNHGDTRCPQ